MIMILHQKICTLILFLQTSSAYRFPPGTGAVQIDSGI